MRRIKEAEKRNLKRKKRIKAKIGLGTLSRPRISVYKSNKYFYAQVIDDEKGNTLLSASTVEKELKLAKNIEGAKKLGEVLAKRLKDKKIDSLVFDRNGYRYHGIIASFTTSLREAGINV